MMQYHTLKTRFQGLSTVLFIILLSILCNSTGFSQQVDQTIPVPDEDLIDIYNENLTLYTDKILLVYYPLDQSMAVHRDIEIAPKLKESYEKNWKDFVKLIIISGYRGTDNIDIEAMKKIDNNPRDSFYILNPSAKSTKELFKVFKEELFGNDPFVTVSDREDAAEGRRNIPIRQSVECTMGDTFIFDLNVLFAKILSEYYRKCLEIIVKPEKQYDDAAVWLDNISKLPEKERKRAGIDMFDKHAKLGTLYAEICCKDKAREQYNKAEKYDDLPIEHERLSSLRESLSREIRIEISPNPAVIKIGQEQQFTAKAYDENGQLLANVTRFDWSIVSDIGEFDPTQIGLFYAQKVGQGTVVASYECSKGTAKVTVIPYRVEISSNPPSLPITVKIGEKLKLIATAYDKDNNPLPEVTKFKWTVEGDVGNIENPEVLAREKEFTPTKVGRGKVTADYLGIPIDKVIATPARFEISPDSVKVKIGQSESFKAIAYNDRNVQLPEVNEFRWAIEGEIGDIQNPEELAAEKEFTAGKVGKGRILADYLGIPSADVIVYPARVEVRPESVENMKVGETQEFEAIAFDHEDKQLPEVTEFQWTVEGELGNIQNPDIPAAKKVFKATQVGKGKVIAAYLGIKEASGSAEVTVINGGDIDRIEISDPTVVKGQTVKFTARALDKNNQEIKTTFEWGVEGGIEKIDDNGLFKAKEVGDGAVTASAGGKTGRAAVKVVPDDSWSIDGFLIFKRPGVKLSTVLFGAGTGLSLVGWPVSYWIADDKYKDIPAPPPSDSPNYEEVMDKRLTLWGETAMWDERKKMLPWTAANFGVASLPFLWDWKDWWPRPDYKLWKFHPFPAVLFAIGGVPFAIKARKAGRLADDTYNKITQGISDNERMRLWGEVEKLDELERMRWINAGVDFTAALLLLFGYDRIDESGVKKEVAGQLTSQHSTHLSLDIGDWFSQRRLSLRFMKTF